MKRTLWYAAVCAAALTACVLPRNVLAVDHIPFSDANGLIQVQGSVDGQPAVPMLVDLGAGVDVLSGDLGRRYVNLKGKYVSLRLTGERTDLPIGTVVSLTLGGVPVAVPNIGIWDGLGGAGVNGLIAAPTFRDIATTFDFRNHEIVIEDATTFPERKRTAVRVPLVLQDDLGISLAVFARFDFGNGKTGLCEIDTGSRGITLDNTFASILGIDLHDPHLKRTPSPYGERVVATIPSITLIGAPDTTMQRPSVTFANLIYDCSVGNDFWAGRVFTLDLSNRAMYVSTAS